MSQRPVTRRTDMATEQLTATRTIAATPQQVFAVLTDPAAHAAIDGTGWVRHERDRERITHDGQVFRMAMFHEGHPDKDYVTANLVTVFDEPASIAWKTGTEDDAGNLSFGGWWWRYDLDASEHGTTVTLTYDWSDVGPDVRSYLTFPPFPPSHLTDSLDHLAEVMKEAERRRLDALVGTWSTESTHPQLPGTVVHGRATFEWLPGERFLMWREERDHPDFPDATSIIGHTPALQIHSFDSRGVHRVMGAAITDEAWTFELARAEQDDTAFAEGSEGFDIRFTGTFADGGATVHGLARLSHDGETWEDDLRTTYRRVDEG